MERIKDKWLGALQNATKRNVIERVNPSRCNTTVRAADRKDNGYVCVCAFDPMCTIGCSSRRDLILSGFYYVARDTNSRIFRQTHTNTHLFPDSIRLTGARSTTLADRRFNHLLFCGAQKERIPPLSLLCCCCCRSFILISIPPRPRPRGDSIIVAVTSVSARLAIV